MGKNASILGTSPGASSPSGEEEGTWDPNSSDGGKEMAGDPMRRSSFTAILLMSDERILILIIIFKNIKFNSSEGGKTIAGELMRRGKKCKNHKCHPKMNPCWKFHPNRTMGKCLKLGGKLEMD